MKLPRPFAKRIEVFSATDHREAREVVNLLEEAGVLAMTEVHHPKKARKFVAHRVYVRRADKDAARDVVNTRNKAIRKQKRKELRQEVGGLTFDAFLEFLFLSF